MAKTIKISYAKLAADYEAMPWKEIVAKYGCSASALRRILDTKTDGTITPRKKAKKKAVQLGAINRALKAAASDATDMQATLTNLLSGLRSRGIASMTLNVETGEAVMTTVSVRTVKVGK